MDKDILPSAQQLYEGIEERHQTFVTSGIPRVAVVAGPKVNLYPLHPEGRTAPESKL